MECVACNTCQHPSEREKEIFPATLETLPASLLKGEFERLW